MITKVLTPKFKVSYPNVFKSKLNDLNGKQEFTLVALFEKGQDLSELKDAAEAAMIEEFGADKKKWPATWKNPFKEQSSQLKDGVLKDGYTEGALFINLKSYKRPGLVGPDNQPIIDEAEFYGGCYARATIVPNAYNMKVNKGVSFWVQNIQKMADGEPLGGRVAAENDFAPIEGTNESSEDMFN